MIVHSIGRKSENDYTRTIKRALESAQRKEERFARKDQGVS